MEEIAVNVAVLQEDRILLTQREDFETRIPPGGGIEEGGRFMPAAVRDGLISPFPALA